VGYVNNAAALAASTGPSASNLSLASSLGVDAAFDGKTLRAAICDSSDELAAVLTHLEPARHARFVETVWTSGLRAALNAQRLADEARLDDIGRELVTTFGEKLEAYHDRQHSDLARALAEYFDPKDGRVAARIDGFLRDGGELARTMDKYLSADGELAKTLARSFGESSALMKRLSPTDSEGLVQLLESKLRTAAEAQRVQFAAALDPANESGSLARFFSKVKQELKSAGEERDKQFAALSRTLDVNDQSSPLSRFFRESSNANREMLKAMNAEDPSTPLGAIKAALVRQLESSTKLQLEKLDAMATVQRDDSLALREAVAKLEERRRVVARSAAAGPTFEDALLVTLAEILRGSTITLDATGNTVGLRPNCKKGDAVVRYGADYNHAGAAVVIEAKHDASYTVSRALTEMEEARSNRDASAGLFVMARSHAPAGFPRFQRYDGDILITWDDGDSASDIVLECALQLALFISPLKRRGSADREDIEALADLEARLEREMGRWNEVQKTADRMHRLADDLVDNARKGLKGMTQLLKSAKHVLKTLGVPVLDAGSSREPALLLAERIELDADAAE
jgi:hypothetical protein